LRVVFDNRHLLELYTTGKSRKYSIPGIQERFSMRIQAIEAAVTIHDLQNQHSLRFERLQGYQNRFSLRVNLQWRLEVEIEWQDEEKTKGVFHIKELSKHYGN
jgi:plasmid maintenance system killer protein